jgi:hypothetical protein
MPPAPTSIYKSTKALLLGQPGQYFTSEAVREALKLKDSNKRVRISKTLSTLAKVKSNGIQRRQNDVGRYEYAFLQQPQAESTTSSPGSRSEITRRRRRQPAAAVPRMPRSTITRLANFLRAYLELAPDEQREAYEWLKAQTQ